VERLTGRQAGLKMLVDEADAPHCKPAGNAAGNFGLTISSGDLSCEGNDDTDSQGYYEYYAHAQVYVGGADPLESQGYASAVKTSFQLLDAAREAKSSRAFLFMGGFFREDWKKNSS
jgi:hypothetical protein